jgi:hypothetical protein
VPSDITTSGVAAGPGAGKGPHAHRSGRLPAWARLARSPGLDGCHERAGRARRAEAAEAPEAAQLAHRGTRFSRKAECFGKRPTLRLRVAQDLDLPTWGGPACPRRPAPGGGGKAVATNAQQPQQRAGGLPLAHPGRASATASTRAPQPPESSLGGAQDARGTLERSLPRPQSSGTMRISAAGSLQRARFSSATARVRIATGERCSRSPCPDATQTLAPCAHWRAAQRCHAPRGLSHLLGHYGLVERHQRDLQAIPGRCDHYIKALARVHLWSCVARPPW